MRVPTSRGLKSNWRPTFAEYRADIDGLRALAVSGVVVYHAPSFGWLSGGFLGVDVFFVISGFLISTLIMKAQQRADFSYRKFWLGRIRRLAPAFLVVSLATAIASLLILRPSQMFSFGQTLLASMVGASNFLFAGQDPYWAPSAAEVPFLHTWSLAVEEQFYVIFPFLMVIALRMQGRFGRLPLFLLLAVVSFAAAIWFGSTNPTASFYLLPSRAWELLIGVILALTLGGEVAGKGVQLSRTAATMTASSGIGLIVLSFAFGGQFITSPSFLTLVPTLGTAMVILAGGTPNLVSRLLGGKLLASAGLISYGLYLWHYPILVLSGHTTNGGQTIEALAVLVSVIFAILTYRFVENPLRSRKWGTLPRFQVTALVLLVSVIGVGSTLTDGYRTAGWPPAAEAAFMESNEQLQEFSVGGSAGNVIVFGDSVMASLVPSLVDGAASSGFTLMDGTEGGCLFAVGLEGARKQCSVETQQRRLDAARAAPPSFVVVGGAYPIALESQSFDNGEGGISPSQSMKFSNPNAPVLSDSEHAEQLIEATLSTFQELLDQNHTLVLVYPIPEVGWNLPEEVNRRMVGDQWVLDAFPGLFRLPVFAGQWPLGEPVSTNIDAFWARTQSTFDMLDAVKGDRVLRVYPHNLFCETHLAERCVTHSESHLFYFDDFHPSRAGADLVSAEIFRVLTGNGRQMSTPEKPSNTVTNPRVSYGRADISAHFPYPYARG